ncbi:MAG TPA: penicillin-binding protein 2 [Oligoflexia bacterium]|nr:penicillin-binding protein 2 [Oligoflexia bacterium]HMP48667.1 penicillin-binding protein 2 [Oligoflexia bacterium]
MNTSFKDPLLISPLARVRIVQLLIAISFVGLLLRLWFLQCLYGSYYRDKSENNRIRTIRTIAPRGSIFDSDGRVLVRNRPSFNIALMREDANNPKETIYEVARIAGLNPDTVFEQYQSDRSTPRFEPKVIVRDISKDILSKVKARAYLLPGVIVQAVPTRTYPYGKSAAQLFGYVREVNKQQLEEKSNVGYRLGDSIGQTGLEKQYESTLRGFSGYLQVEVDAMGSRKKELDLIEAEPGQDIHLTIDLDLQRAAEEAIGNRKGALVALDVRNGAVLSLVSMPTFDANTFSGSVKAKEWQELATDKSKPLTNRAISSVYPPGSTSKLLWSVAGLQERKITSGSRLNCPGYYSLGSRRYLCHKKTGHGPLDLKMAVTLSCNAFYYNLGQMLGIDTMSQYLKWFGVGQLSGIDIQGEVAGILPSNEWKKERFKEKWYPGDSVPVSIGQGYYVASPLQMAIQMMLIANDGQMLKPYLVAKRFDKDLNSVVITEPQLLWTVPVNKEHFRTVREAAESVVANDRGTGKRARLSGVSVGGKTGTAQVSRRGTERKTKELMDHAWFIAFAPVERPEIALAVVVENAGGGGEFAAPVARAVLYEYFKKKGLIKEEFDTNIVNNVSTNQENELAKTRELQKITGIEMEGLSHDDSIADPEYVPLDDFIDFDSTNISELDE